MELPGRNRVIAGFALVGLSIGFFIYGGSKIGRYADIQSNILVKNVDRTVSNNPSLNEEVCEEDSEFAYNQLVRGGYAVGGGLVSLVLGIVIGGTGTSFRYEKEEKKGKRKSYSQIEGRYKIETNDCVYRDRKDLI